MIWFAVYPRQAQRLITDPSKNIFVPLVVLSFATLIIGTINYAVVPGYIHPDLVYGLFWLYVALAVLVTFPLLMLWFNRPHDITTFTPAWMFLIFPLMLVGVVAFNVLKIMDPSDARTVGILYVGYFFQGIGSFVAMFYIAIYILRLMMASPNLPSMLAVTADTDMATDGLLGRTSGEQAHPAPIHADVNMLQRLMVHSSHVVLQASPPSR